MTTIKYMRDEYQSDIDRLNDEVEETGIDMDSEIEESQEHVERYNFCIDLCSKLKESGIEMIHTDFSAQSEAMYFEVTKEHVVLKLRIASHSSCYDKDIDFQMSSFRNYNSFDLNSALNQVIRSFKTTQS